MHINECLLTYNPQRLNKVQYKKWYRKFTTDELIGKFPSLPIRTTHTNSVSETWYFYQLYYTRLTGLEFLQKIESVRMYCTSEILNDKYWKTLLNTIQHLRCSVEIYGYRKRSNLELTRLHFSPSLASLLLKTKEFDLESKQPDVILSKIYTRHISQDLALLLALDQSKNLRDISEVILKDYSDRPVKAVRKLIKKKQNILL